MPFKCGYIDNPTCIPRYGLMVAVVAVILMGFYFIKYYSDKYPDKKDTGFSPGLYAALGILSFVLGYASSFITIT